MQIVCGNREKRLHNKRDQTPFQKTETERLTTETVQGAALSLQSVDDVERCDGLALGVLSVGDGVTNNTLKEGLQDTSGLLVDHCGTAGLDMIDSR